MKIAIVMRSRTDLGRRAALVAAALAFALTAVALAGCSAVVTPSPAASAASAGVSASSDQGWRGGQEVSGSGVVTRILADDTSGGRHQRFILQLASGRTILIAHNIDIAPRVSPLRVGDTVEFSGQFETNAQGGVVHWTHHDPSGKHPTGWLRAGGRTYQ